MAKKTIMIIEDDSFVMDIYQTKLSLEGFDIIAANNGMEALEKLEKIDCKPDLILLDIIMPFVNGLEVLEKIKNNDRLKKIPIILLTNLSQKEDIDQGMILGADDYLIKSHFTPSEVLAKIRIYLDKEEQVSDID
ncbi:MAG: response regulator [Candidatus Moranbacteria bacterium]|nr:response regulator [Candidatus Moranbacteria bacterium]